MQGLALNECSMGALEPFVETADGVGKDTRSGTGRNAMFFSTFGFVSRQWKPLLEGE